MKRRKNVVYDVTNVEQHVLFGSDASRPLPDVIPKRANSLAVVEGVLSRFFQPTDAASAIKHVCQARFVVQAEKGNTFRASHQVSENSELFKKLDPGAQFQWERISPAVQLCRSLRGSEAEPTTSSRYSSFRGRERSLCPRRLGRAVRLSRKNRVSPKGLRRPSAFGSDLRRGKVQLAFRLHTASPVKDLPKYAGLSASQGLSRSGIPRSPLRVHWIQTCLRTIGLAPPQSNLERDCWSVNRCALGRGSTANCKGSRGRRTRRTPAPCPLRTTSLKARFPPQNSPWLELPTNFAPVGGRARTTPRGCGRVRHSRGRALEEYCYPSKHRAANLRFCQNWPWPL